MTPRIETSRFSWDDPAAKFFFDRHGYVIVRDVFTQDDRKAMFAGWAAVVQSAAERVGLAPDVFARRFPQNRDLWCNSDAYRSLLFETRQGEVTKTFLGSSGVRLFHDHAIAKPASSSAIIPWHQDSAYWPLDRVGLSLWTPVEAVTTNGGCLKVLEGSHLDGPCEPQDFLASPTFDRDADPRLVLLPVEAGESVVLNGLTWHGSGPNTGGVDRLAYLTLWVPSAARFVSNHAAWHPTVPNIRVAPGERLDGDMFPLFGAVPEADEGEPVVFPLPVRTSGPSMFTASKDIGHQIAWLLDLPRASLDQLLGDGGGEIFVRRAAAGGLIRGEDEDALRGLLHELLVQERVRKDSVARDVYLGTTMRWWAIIGHRIDEVLRDG